MKVLVVNDSAGRLDLLEAALCNASAHAVDAVFVLGGFGPYGPTRPPDDQDQYAATLAMLGRAGRPTYIIPSQRDNTWQLLNCAVHGYHGPGAQHFVHRSLATLGDDSIVIGFGGIIAEPGEQPGPAAFPEWEVRATFLRISTYMPAFREARRRIFLFATPPYAEYVDQFRGQHHGSRVLRSIIKRYRPDLVCCAGPAAAAGTEVVEGVPVLNPGSLSHGAYALLDLDLLLAQLDHLCVAPGKTCLLGSSITGFEHSGR